MRWSGKLTLKSLMAIVLIDKDIICQRNGIC